MKITINIPRGFTEDIVININAEPLPFSDGLPNEELVEELNKPLTDAERKEYMDLNPQADYLMRYMSGENLELIEEGGDIDG